MLVLVFIQQSCGNMVLNVFKVAQTEQHCCTICCRIIRLEFPGRYEMKMLHIMHHSNIYVSEVKPRVLKLVLYCCSIAYQMSLQTILSEEWWYVEAVAYLCETQNFYVTPKSQPQFGQKVLSQKLLPRLKIDSA